ncbi:MAG TPA: M13 family metallopeptidase [Chitinophagales bacterium]|nr:M13 family metallopeptidase [Chitinophagales bacterium]
MKKLLLAPFAGIMIFISCTPAKKEMNKEYTAIDVTAFDSSYAPAQDFYEFINAKWISNNPIPATESSRRAFEVVDDSVRNKLKKVLEAAAADKNAAKGSSAQKVGDFFATGMDSVAIDQAGITPLKPWFDSIAAFKNTDDVIRFTAHSNFVNSTALLTIFVDQDQKDSKNYILYMPQTGISLPDRDYYFLTDMKSKQIRDEYVKHITKYFTLMGSDGAVAEKNAATVIRIETALAKASMTRVQQRDPYATYNKMAAADLKKNYAVINWDVYFKTLELKPFDSLIVNQPLYLKQVSEVLKSASIDDWKTYYSYHLINSAASNISADFANEDFNFYSKTIRGIEQIDPRWKRIQDLENFCLGELVGQEYVKTNFTPESKKRMLELIHNLIDSYSERIAKVDWMNDTTKEYAQKKLSQLMIKVGYPDKWRDYSSVEIDKGPFILNVARSIEFEVRRNLSKLGTPVDRTEWLMTPQTVNAYYNPTNNEIVFPAAILQPPFFYADGDDAVNYGGIGAVIGHEITHGFDDQGRQYDAEGNLRDWWTKSDGEQYNARTKLITEQFNAYSPIDSFFINGELTQGENIADLGGLTISYYAFKKATPRSEQDTMVIKGLTPDQRFFISFAQVWAGSFRPEEQKRRLVMDPHSPGKYRVVGTLSNMPEFYQAFGVKEGDKMYRNEAVRGKVW